MTVMPTKADRIRAFYNAGLSTREIADRIGCDPAYVRVAARQRAGGYMSACDAEYKSRLAALGDRVCAREAGRRAYHKARSAGQSRQDAARFSRRAYEATMRRTAKERLARENAGPSGEGPGARHRR